MLRLLSHGPERSETHPSLELWAPGHRQLWLGSAMFQDRPVLGGKPSGWKLPATAGGRKRVSACDLPGPAGRGVVGNVVTGLDDVSVGVFVCTRMRMVGSTS